jgi:K+-sensing histidine kinase KdpD
LPSCRWLFVPLAASGKGVGVLGLWPLSAAVLPPDQTQLLMTLAMLIAGVIERMVRHQRENQPHEG